MGIFAVSSSQFLSKSHTLHWYHWCVFAASLVLTVSAWYYTKNQIFEKVEASFDREASKTVELIHERMQKYEDVLWSGAGLFHASEEVTLSEWRKFAQMVGIEKKYPGINGIGVISFIQPENLEQKLKDLRKEQPNFRIHPKHSKNIFMPIIFIEPLKGNEAAVGLDMAHETNRYTAALQSKETRTAQITGPITLIQDSGKTPGFLFYVPIFEMQKDGFGSVTGFVYAPFVVKKLMEGTLSREERHVTVSIQDGDIQIFNENRIHDKHTDPSPLFKKQLSLDMYGRNWVFHIESDLQFRMAVQNNQPLTILLGGLTIDFMLLFLFFMLSRSNKNAIDYANEATKNLREKAKSLEKSNKELEKFAYIASHDLKAPLRGIDNIVSWIEEDAGDSLDSNVQEHLAKLKGRVCRMNNLIKGILEYSKINALKNRENQLIDVEHILHDIKEQHQMEKKININVSADLPVIYGSPMHFKQIANNLISNAIKYNDKDQIEISIFTQENDEHIEFVFKDNGPGIEEKFHEKIFELFHTLQPKDEFESTGVGLSIVKKIIEENGGAVWVNSKTDQGSQFHFSWPKDGDVWLKK